MTPAAKRKAVAHLVGIHGMSERRACKAIGCCRMTVRYQTSRSDDAGLRQRMRAIAHERRRFGYRRLHVMLKREGYHVNHKKLFRLYREEKLTVRRRGGRKRALGTRAPMTVPVLPNDRWSLDFVSDQMTDGRRFRTLTVVYDCTLRYRSGVLCVAESTTVLWGAVTFIWDEVQSYGVRKTDVVALKTNGRRAFQMPVHRGNSGQRSQKSEHSLLGDCQRTATA
ncbi:helix-turn-helix protein [Rhodopseudomonas faecalis]|uniref:Helix-turn-helix protein n=1 Tax=Rhodopseudomonas faecalis TaxID=99655 RepID=A0A318TF53_9BRAD|nr:helix-turn-helix protein [Rhodopseudomonas faecalis]